MNGGQLSNKVIKYIETRYGGYAFNLVSSGTDGNADVIACIKGKFFAFEVKAGKDSQKRLQSAKLNSIRESGGYGGYVRSLNDVTRIVDNLEQPNYAIGQDIKISL